VRTARQRLGWSREALAFLSEISWSAIAQIETGRRRNLRPATLAALAEALGVTIDYLISGRSPNRPMLEHYALLYDSDAGFVDTAAPFLAEASDRSQGALAVTTRGNINLLRERLGPAAGGVKFVESSGWYRSPVAALFSYQEFVDQMLGAGVPWIRIVGEPVWAGRSESDVRVWTRYESLINLVFSAAPVSLICPYDTRAVDGEIVRRARVTHPCTMHRDSVATSPDYADPSGFVLES
jgi:transcriptional regulator with XRE-family HTH domain